MQDTGKLKLNLAINRRRHSLLEGVYLKYNVMPLGLCNAPATFERLKEMITNFDTVRHRFEKAGLKLRPNK